MGRPFVSFLDDSMAKPVIAGWIILILGTIVWLYGYFVTGHPPLFDWQARTPSWIADYLPSIESEIGMALVWASMIPMYWPSQR